MVSTPAARVAVVTGAGRGIGRAIARRLSADGFVVVAAARTRAQLQETAGGDAAIATVVADVARPQDVARLAAAADLQGRLEVWVNNAATLERVAFEDLDPERWNRVLGVNLHGTYLGCRAAYPRLRAAGGGVIVNIASLSGVPMVEKFPGLAAYNVSKAAVAALSEAVAVEGREHGVRCICLSPGAVDTEMLRQANPQLRAGMTPAQLADIVSFAVSPAGAPLSGSNLPIFSNLPPEG